MERWNCFTRQVMNAIFHYTTINTQNTEIYLKYVDTNYVASKILLQSKRKCLKVLHDSINFKYIDNLLKKQ